MPKTWVAVGAVLISLSIAPIAAAKKVPTVPSITGAVYTTVDPTDPNYMKECKNGNPAVNCNQYTGKQYVFLNGGPQKNQLSPDGVYFYAVLNPSGQANPNDGSAENLSDNYDCYRNREILIHTGEVSQILSATDAACFTSGTPFTHVFHSPFVQLFPYADTLNPGGVYIMAVCYVGPAGTTTLSAPVAPDLCKYDAFKVVADTTPPVCKLISKSGPTISVAVQDSGAGLESVDYTANNATVTFPTPLVVGSTDAFYINATKVDASTGATLELVVTDPAGNQTICDPVYGQASAPIKTTVKAGSRVVLLGVGASKTHLAFRNIGTGIRGAVVLVNGRRFAIVSLHGHRPAVVDLAAGVLSHARNTVTVKAIGTRGKLLVQAVK